MNERNHEQDDLKKKFDNVYQYIKNVTTIYRNISSTFMVVSLTAFIFLLSASVSYPDLLDVYIIIKHIAIKAISLSLMLLVFSFFLFLISTIIYLYKGVKANNIYFYNKSELNLTESYEKLDKLTNLFYVGILLGAGILALIVAVIFMFLYFSATEIIFAFILLAIIVICIYIFSIFIKYTKR